ncbi:MAG TPA: hypothetical protein VHK90_08760, partial [Thermoanaerobaculia bacterium]|nr:hypothetical protein [Thermoanaerobaculia bacterium]
PERPVTPAVPGPYAIAALGDAASNGELTLVVWSDGRSRQSYDIFAARVAADGTVLDPVGIAITRTTTVYEVEPQVIWDGSRFVIAWTTQTGEVSIAAVDPQGVVTPPVRVAEQSFVQSLAQNGGRTLLTLRSGPTAVGYAGFIGSDLRFHQVVTLDALAPKVAALGSGFIALFLRHDPAADGWRVYGQLLDGDAQPAGAPFLLADLGVFRNGPSLALADGILAASASGRFVIARLDAEGRTSQVTELSDHATVWDVVPHAAGFDVVAYEIEGPLTYRFDAQGVRRERPATATRNSYVGAGVIANGKVFVAWNIEGNIIGTFPFGEEKLVLVSQAPAAQVAPAAGPGITAWAESRSGSTIEYRVMAQLGDGEPLVIDDIIDGTVAPPAVAFDGVAWWIAWKDDLVDSMQLYQRLLVRRIAPDGTLGDVQTISIHAHELSSPAMASDGSRVLLAWGEGPWIASPFVRTALLGGDTTRIVDMPGGGSTPSIAFDGSRYLVVTATGAGSVHGMYVDRGGAAGPPFQIATGTRPSVAWDGRRFVVVYTRPEGLFGTFVGSGEEIPLGTSLATPRITYDGISFVVTSGGSVMRVFSDGTKTPPVEVTSGSLFPFGSRLVYLRNVAELERVPRVFTRWLVPSRRRAVQR